MTAEPLTPQEIKEWKEKIDQMSHVEMARLYRFADVGHPLFDSRSELCDYFNKAFKQKGGMTPEISKHIGFGI